MKKNVFWSLIPTLAAVLMLTTGCGSDDNYGDANYAVPPSQNCLGLDDPRCYNYGNIYGHGFNNYPHGAQGYGHYGNPYNYSAQACGQHYGPRWNTGWDPYRTQPFCFQAGVYGQIGSWGFQRMCDLRYPNSCMTGYCVPMQPGSPIGTCR